LIYTQLELNRKIVQIIYKRFIFCQNQCPLLT